MTQLTPEQINQIRAKSGLPPLPPKTPQTPGAAVVGKYDYLLQEQQPEKEPGFLSKVATNIKNVFTGGAKKITEDISNNKNLAERAGGGAVANVLAAGSTAGHIAGDVAGAAGGLIGSFIEPLLSPSVKQKVGNVSSYLDDKIKSIPGMTPEIQQSLGDVFNSVSLLGGGKGANAAKNGTIKAGEAVGEFGTKAVKDVRSIAEKIPQYGEKATKLLASEPSEQIKTILKETPKSTFDEYLNIAGDHLIDQRKMSVFEKVGDKMAEATKQLKSQVDSIGAQKSSIINQAKVGLQPFVEAPRRAILKVMKLADNPLKNQVIEKLKTVKTKLDADRVIDEIQADIYNAGGTNLIAKGSAIEKQLRGIVGEMNTELKNTLPTAYKVLNAKYANRIQVVGTLNRALGEVVDGVATRGTGLVKQFFSPAGTKTKELFDFIKKNTGIDLAQDATVAKFMGELFEDPKVKSLLDGIPTSKSGYVNKAIDFVVDKSGLGKKMQGKFRKATVDKAREFTK